MYALLLIPLFLAADALSELGTTKAEAKKCSITLFEHLARKDLLSRQCMSFQSDTVWSFGMEGGIGNQAVVGFTSGQNVRY